VEDDEVYHIDFTSIEAAKQYRAPRRTPWPRIWGMETAVIDGSLDSEYAQIDEHGRYFVKILFDETDLRNGRASTRVRMLQPHGGSTEGFHFPLRKGTEVTLAFLGGDPDRPVIAAVAPNAERVSPVTEGNHTLNVLQTGGSNRLEIEDSNGAQYIKWHTPHEDTMFHLGSKHNPKFHVWLKTLGDCGFHYGTDWEVKVGGWHHEDVTGEVVQHYKNGQKTTVDAAIRESYFNAAHRQEIKGGEDLIVHDGGRRDTVTGDVVETYKNKMKTEVTGLREEVYHASQTVDVTGTMTETVSGAVDETYGSWKATSKGTTDIISKAGAMTVDATGQKFSLLANQKEETITADENKKILGGRMTMASADRKIVLGDVAIDIFVGLKMEAALAVALSMFVGLKYEGSFAIRLEDHKLEAKSGIAAMKTIATEVKAIASIIKNGGIDIDLTGMNLM
jgi:type VI secretion system secreted protein VgrG